MTLQNLSAEPAVTLQSLSAAEGGRKSRRHSTDSTLSRGSTGTADVAGERRRHRSFAHVHRVATLYNFDCLEAPADEEGGGATAGEAPPADCREALVRFYSRVAPSKVNNVDTILERFKGAEENMFLMIDQMYPDEDPVERPAAFSVRQQRPSVKAWAAEQIRAAALRQQQDERRSQIRAREHRERRMRLMHEDVDDQSDGDEGTLFAPDPDDHLWDVDHVYSGEEDNNNDDSDKEDDDPFAYDAIDHEHPLYAADEDDESDDDDEDDDEWLKVLLHGIRASRTHA